MEDVLRDAWAQFGFAVPFALSGWVVAWLLYREYRSLLARYHETLERASQVNPEIQKTLASLAENLRFQDVLREELERWQKQNKAQ